MKSNLIRLNVLFVIMILSISAYSQPPASWLYNVTGNNHTILILNTTPVLIDGIAAPTTDCWIGVFYHNSSGTLSCGGYTMWQGLTTYITSWGDDNSPLIEGFGIGEEFTWKLYTNGIEYDLIATYDSTFLSNSQYVYNGMSSVTSLSFNCSYDLEAVEILEPQSRCDLTSNENITVSFKNDSLCEVAGNVNLMYSINGGISWVTEIAYFTIPVGDTAYYTFNSQADFYALTGTYPNYTDSTYIVSFKVELAGDSDSTDNLVMSNVTHLVPMEVNLTGLDETYCLYTSNAITLTGSPSGGVFTGNGVQGNVFLMGYGGYPFATLGVNVVTYTYFDVTTGCGGFDTDTVTLYEVPEATISGFTSLDVCQYDTVLLVGNPSGGTFVGSPYIGPTIGVFNPLTPGLYNIQYFYTDANTCTDTSDVYTFNILPIPNAVINNFHRSYCEDDSNIILEATPTGGEFSVDNTVLQSNILDPSILNISIHTLNYNYTDSNGCSDNYLKNFKIFPLPIVSLSPFDTTYCQFDDSVSLVGFPAMGTFTGTSWENWFNPIDAGQHNIEYSYTRSYQYYGDTAYCDNQASQMVNVIEFPIIDLGPDYEFYINIGTELDAGIYDSYLWSTGETTQQISITLEGVYSVTVSNSSGCSGEDDILLSYNPNPSHPNWNFVYSGSTHSIQIPSNAVLEIGGGLISNGDFIGVFYDSLGTQACAGYTIWQGNNEIVIAYGDGPTSSNPDGFIVGEELSWIIWDSSTNIEFLAVASYDTTYSDQQYWQINGESGLDSLHSASITGTISISTKGNLPLGIVVLYEPNQGSYYAINKGLVEDGNYKIEGVLPGQYLVYAIPVYGYDYGVPGYYGQSNNWNNATLVTVDGLTDGVDISINPGFIINPGIGVISGNIYVGSDNSYNPDVFGEDWFAGYVKDDEEPARNIPVLLYDNQMNLIDFRLTSDVGGFEFEQLELGTYFIKVEKAGLLAEDIEIILSQEDPVTGGIVFSLESGEVLLSVSEPSFIGEVSIYPNPFKDEFIVEGLKSNDKIRIFDVLGKELEIKFVTNKAGKISLHGEKDGLYFIMIERENHVSIFKIVKE